MALDILIVDDEQDIRDLVSGVLEDEGYAARSAGNSDATLEAIADRRPSLVLLDVWLQGSRLDGLDLLEEIKRRDPSLPVLVMSGHGNLDTAVAAIRLGLVEGPVTVALPGGTLEIDWRPGESIRMTGPATHVFTGELDASWLA